ncbi:MAG: FG-GAP-like repeat-containing protein, partial [Methanimicrococcus sp.]|nr:FG-GAP-like repeat-containing protein [Methanimicrococcus sp.]
MDLKKFITFCIALMILTPSFSFALEAEPSDSSSGSFSSLDSSPSETARASKSDGVTENFDNYTFSDLEETNLDGLLQEENLGIFDSDETMSMMAGVTSAGPEFDLSSLTSIQEDFGFSNDAYLTSLFSGAAVYTYPINVPKGIAGFQPKVELSYNSQSVGGHYGWLGDGWSLNEYYILRDINYTPNNTSDDRFKLIFDGQSHKLIYSETDGFYHTEIETYMKIQKEAGGSNQKGEYWTVTTKDGTLYRFGYTSDSELLNSVSGRDYVTKWKLDQIEDVNGNLIVYNYVKNPVAGEIGTSYLSNISYNNGFNIIEFERMNKPVTFKGYRDGSQVSEKCLLSAVSIKAEEQLVYKYKIQYASKNHVLLDSISLIGADDTSLPATIFSYGEIDDFVFDSSWEFPTYIVDTTRDLGVRFVDVNGDGLTDIVQSFDRGTTPILPPGSSVSNVWINTGSGFVLDSSRSIPLRIIMDEHDTGARFVDINGDGLTDIVLAFTSSTYVWINTGSDFVLDSTWSIPIKYTWDKYIHFADINNDGLPDIVQFNPLTSASNVWINTGSGFVLDSSWSTPNLSGPETNGIIFTDINGDGYPDIIANTSSGKVLINTGS